MFPTDVSSFSQLFSTEQVVFYLALSIANGVLLLFASMKYLLVLQQCGYWRKRYFKWVGSKDSSYNSRLMLLCLLAFLFFCVLCVCFSGMLGNTIASYVGFVSYFLFMTVYINTEKNVNSKIPLRKTPRLVRLIITYIIVLTAVTFGVIVLFNYLSFVIDEKVFAILRFSVICVLPVLVPYLLFAAYCVNEPLEWCVRRYYLEKARQKLAKADVIRIGITGSYGKTSVKEILKTVLSQKFRVLATPQSYNTPLGMALTVKNLDSTHDIFIAEMGARSKGDIKQLADLVKPNYGILTGINSQHLETFLTIENTKDTKFELFENLTEEGAGFFSHDNQGSVELYERFCGKKFYAGCTGRNNLVYASDIHTDRNGTQFILNVKGEQPVICSTVLLGKHSISNICLAAAMAYELGMTPYEIALGINRIRSVEHRLELRPNNKNIVIIDDSYNSNTDGIKAAMEVLDMFDGRKIVVTPGLVELGKEENLANFEFGKTLAEHSDMVIIVGKHNALMIINGLLENGMSRENIKFAKSLNKGNEILNDVMKEGDVVLFENDLPDNYN